MAAGHPGGRAAAPLTDGDLRKVTEAERTRWYSRRRSTGWRPAAGDARDHGAALVNNDVVL
jgi:hypothetical protein